MRGNCRVWQMVVYLVALLCAGFLAWYLRGLAIYVARKNDAKETVCVNKTATPQPPIDGASSTTLNPVENTIIRTCVLVNPHEDSIFNFVNLIYVLIGIAILITITVFVSRWIEKSFYRYHHNKLKRNTSIASLLNKDEPHERELWEFVVNLIHKTWIYRDQEYRDQRKLSHNKLHVRQIYMIHNDDLKEKYRTKLSSQRRRCHGVEHEIERMLTRDVMAKFLASKQQPYVFSKAIRNMQLRPEIPVTDETKEKHRRVSCSNIERVHRSERRHGSFDSSAQAASRDNELCKASLSGSSLALISGSNKSLHSATESASRKTSTSSRPDIALLKANAQASPVPLLSENELFLFHGTRIQNISKICKKGFRFEKASTIALYGRGLYFTDSSQKADQYADVAVNRKKKLLAMILSRVVIGKTGRHVPRTQREEQPEEPKEPEYDTLLAGEGRRFRELIKYDPEQCYPSFVIIYDRILEEEA